MKQTIGWLLMIPAFLAIAFGFLVLLGAIIEGIISMYKEDKKDLTASVVVAVIAICFFIGACLVELP